MHVNAGMGVFSKSANVVSFLIMLVKVCRYVRVVVCLCLYVYRPSCHFPF